MKFLHNLISNTVGSGVDLGVGSGIGILSRFFTGNILLLILSRIIPLVLRNNPTLIGKNLS